MGNRRFLPEETGVCPYCNVLVRFEAAGMGNAFSVAGPLTRISTLHLQALQGGSRPPDRRWLLLDVATCPNCRGVILSFRNGFLLLPDSSARRVPEEVEQQFPELATDIREAALVLSKSRKASAALSRRCLQMILVSKGGAKAEAKLYRHIDDVLGSLPSDLGANLNAIREIGNFAAHPSSTAAGEIVEVEESEAEWLLDILEELFDHYYVKPSKGASLHHALQEKVADMKKGV